MAKIASQLGLYLLNGTFPEDPPAEFTYMSGQGSRTIDYMLVSASLIPLITSFQVLPYLESDHFPLLLQAKPLFTTQTMTEQPSHEDSQTLTCKVSWSALVQSRFREVL